MRYRTVTAALAAASLLHSPTPGFAQSAPQPAASVESGLQLADEDDDNHRRRRRGILLWLVIGGLAAALAAYLLHALLKRRSPPAPTPPAAPPRLQRLSWPRIAPAGKGALWTLT